MNCLKCCMFPKNRVSRKFDRPPPSAVRSRPLVHIEKYSQYPRHGQHKRNNANDISAPIQLLGLINEAVIEFGLRLERESDRDQTRWEEEEQSKTAHPTPIIDSLGRIGVILLSPAHRVHGASSRDGRRGRLYRGSALIQRICWSYLRVFLNNINQSIIQSIKLQK